MPKIVHPRAARAQLRHLLGRGARIARTGGTPYAHLKPLDVRRFRQFGVLAGQLQLSEASNAELMRSMTEEELADWEGDIYPPTDGGGWR